MTTDSTDTTLAAAVESISLEDHGSRRGKRPLDVAFVAEAAGITTEEALDRVKTVIKAVEESHHVYRCIERAMFAVPRVINHPLYPSLVKRFGKDDSPRVLELGCCFGTDARKMIRDGLDPAKLVVTDLHDAYWDMGKSLLFNDDPQGFKVVFGDFATEEPSMVKLHDFEGAFDVISAQAILHVLSKEQCIAFLRNCSASLKGDGKSVLFGTCIGMVLEAQNGDPTPTKGLPGREALPRFWHTKDTLAALLKDVGFKQVEVDLVATMTDKEGVEKGRLVFTAYK
ncbi:hypothetical protein HDU96_008734 [Phlyctochytrium bullatum]|nr:hypothetical protein HDU96_008734 [Phlyctochytrium bullatum]